MGKSIRIQRVKGLWENQSEYKELKDYGKIHQSEYKKLKDYGKIHQNTKS